MRTLMHITSVLVLAASTLAAQTASAPAKRPAPAKSAAATATSELIDVNTASAEQLASVPGIGEAYAKKIIAGRPYKAKNELLQKKVLPAGVYQKAKDRIVAHRKG
ncbi:MAG TPA: helix-hairpin-helix domain-containing protein [Bryobacteraceae bacterium]|nr:helix-hairpin-helix domain-containing protein [Bryobacteraceae bacterium]